MPSQDLDREIYEIEPRISHLRINSCSDYIMERSMDAIFYGEEPRSFSEIGSIKQIDDGELKLDGLDYFETVKNEIQEEFYNRLAEEIGYEKTDYFCKLIKDYWYVGSKRNSKKIKELKNSIRIYLERIPLQSGIYVIKKDDQNNIGLITPDDIQEIVLINKEMFDLYIQNWISKTSSINEKTTEYLFFRRGLTISTIEKEYLEYDYINSYSISATVAEQFSTMTDEKCTLIVNAEYGLLYDRILFFSPFIKNMNIRQFEVGIIPHTMPLICERIGVFDGIEEYQLSKQSHLN